MELFQKRKRKISNKPHKSKVKKWSLVKTDETQGKPPWHISGHAPAQPPTSPTLWPKGRPTATTQPHPDFRDELAHPPTQEQSQPKCPQSTAQPLLSPLCAAQQWVQGNSFSSS